MSVDAVAQAALQDAVLDEETLARLVADIEALCVVDEVLLKGGAAERASSERVSVAEGVAELLQGRVRGLQVRYQHEERMWWDTLLRVPGGVRLVRIEHVAARGV